MDENEITPAEAVEATEGEVVEAPVMEEGAEVATEEVAPEGTVDEEAA